MNSLSNQSAAIPGENAAKRRRNSLALSVLAGVAVLGSAVVVGTGKLTAAETAGCLAIGVLIVLSWTGVSVVTTRRAAKNARPRTDEVAKLLDNAVLGFGGLLLINTIGNVEFHRDHWHGWPIIAAASAALVLVEFVQRRFGLGYSE